MAKIQLQESLDIYEKHFGVKCIKTARVLNELGQVHLLEGDLVKAEEFFLKSLEILQKNNHPEKYAALESLSDLYLKKASLIENTQNQINLRDQA